MTSWQRVKRRTLARIRRRLRKSVLTVSVFGRIYRLDLRTGDFLPANTPVRVKRTKRQRRRERG